jgi:purine-binding chemotaxis protein CheW
MTDMVLTAQRDRSFVTFRVQGRRYGLDVEQVREVSTHVTCTPVPQTPLMVRGLTNLRSRIYLVLDARAALHGEPTQCTADSRLVVLHERVGEQLGLLVEQGGDVVYVSADQIEAAAPEGAAEASAPAGPVVAVCKLEDELVMVIDAATVVGELETALRGRPAGAGVDSASAGKALP